MEEVKLDWEKNVDPNFKDNNYLEPIVADQGPGWCDRWIVYGTVDGEQLFTARELTVDPGCKCTLTDPGASSWITVQGKGRLGALDLQTPVIMRYGQLSEDEVFISHHAASAGVEVENNGSEPLDLLRVSSKGYEMNYARSIGLGEEGGSSPGFQPLVFFCSFSG